MTDTRSKDHSSPKSGVVGDVEGKSRPTLAQVAKAAAVSIATVSRVLDDHPAITAETKLRVREAALALGYPLRDGAAAKARGKRARKVWRKGSVCVVMAVALPGGSPLCNDFELKLLGGIGAAMRDNGLDFTVVAVSPYDDESLAEFMARRACEGLIFLGQSQFHAGLNAAAGKTCPFVVWGVNAPDQRYCSIGSDNFEGGLKATRHLIGLGRQRIAFVGQAAPITSAQTPLSQSAERVAGFRAAMAEAGLPADLVANRPAPTAQMAGAKAVAALLAEEKRIDAIVASSDLIAIGAIEELARHDLAVPRDVAVVGYDDADAASFVRPALTTIRQDTLAAGRLLVGALLKAMAGGQPRSERLPTELVIRESCGSAFDPVRSSARNAKTAISP